MAEEDRAGFSSKTNTIELIMKLELKHLAPYLPFKLEIQVAGENIDDDPEGLPRIFTMVGIVDGEVIRSKKGYIRNVEEEIEDVFPILRPLSDLNKEIKVNGNLFTPNHHPLFKIFISADMDWFIDNCPFFVDYGQVQKLLEWHFDIFGLIELGLAIDKNTL
jgi:hypothetical protein